jgi:hypothetical protein
MVDRLEQDRRPPGARQPACRGDRPARPARHPAARGPRRARGEPDEPFSGVDGAESQAASLLPALDPTPMGWKHRGWMFGIDQRAVFDGAGNIGPTVWWNGEAVGSWAITAAGELRTRILADRGSEAAAAVDTAAEQLHARLDGAVVTPAVRTPLERSITDIT